ncbi:hypothetical protein ES703_43388 [subsurface metagenome]
MTMIQSIVAKFVENTSIAYGLLLCDVLWIEFIFKYYIYHISEALVIKILKSG